MTDLNSYEESLANDLAKAEALIEELVKERDTAREYAGEVRIREKVADDARIEAEAKLAKAAEALEDLVRDCEADYPPSNGAIKHFAIATLAEIKGGNDAESNL